MNNHIISSGAPLLSALEALNGLSGQVMTLLAVDSDGRLEGTLTDGDVRRALLRGVRLSDPVSAAMFRDFHAIGADADPRDIRASRRLGLGLLPIVDDRGRLVDMLDLSRQTSRLPVRAVLMAGGRGERLRPLTDKTPKPLLPIGGSTVIDLNVDALRRCGVGEIFVTVRYLAEQLEEHFAGTEVTCVRETEPLGTIGALFLLPPAPEGGTTLLMNSDLVTNIDFEEFFLHHRETGDAITVATVSHVLSIPFSILQTEGNRVTAIEEKPTFTNYAGAGIYLIENSLLRDLPPVRDDAPDFVARAIEAGVPVGHFPISGTWKDIGTPADYRQACELLDLARR